MLSGNLEFKSYKIIKDPFYERDLRIALSAINPNHSGALLTFIFTLMSLPLIELSSRLIDKRVVVGEGESIKASI